MATKKEATAVMPTERRVRHFADSELISNSGENPWTDVLKSPITTDFQIYRKTVDLCRFFYKTEPMVSTVINKLVEIGINDLVLSKNGVSDNEFRVFEAVKPKMIEFAENMAQEFLLSGLVIPEVSYNPVDKDFLMTYGIKKYPSLKLPDSMWVRSPDNIKIYSSIMTDKPSYYMVVPDDVIYFIKNKGQYPDGKEDRELYDLFLKQYPDFVKEINKGTTEFLLDNKWIVRRKYMVNNPYPIPYISSSLDVLQHKRKLRRMDYSIVDKVITAIQHIKMGSDEFPMTDSEEDKVAVTNIRNQLRARTATDSKLERIFQLITNHTVDINWVFPNVEPLLNNDKYVDINQEILFGLGFPRVLITGETQRTGTSDPELAIIGPVKTMENFRNKLLPIVSDIVRNVSELNGFRNVPEVKFAAINLHNFNDFVAGLVKLYDASAVSRTSLAELYGYDFTTEVDRLEEEANLLEEKNLPGYGPTPFGNNQPVQTDNQQQDKTQDKNQNQDQTQQNPAKKQ